MTRRIVVAGRTRTVEVRREGGSYVAIVDGRRHPVDVSQAGGSWSLLLGTRSHDVRFAEESAGALVAVVDGRRVGVAVESPRRSTSGGRGAAAGGTSAGPHTVVAPMPGKIVKVLVRPGDAVQARQGLVVVEAMKMENELRSQRAGTVSEVRVTEGASVETGTILVIVE